jgi:hypothetical protein
MAITYKVKVEGRIYESKRSDYALPNKETMEFRYDPTKPFEVQLHIEGDNLWTFSRDLLAEAVEGVPAGLGDVRVFPTEQDIHITLDPGKSYHATLVFPLDKVTWFLKGTFRRVPRGKEHIDQARYDKFLIMCIEHQFVNSEAVWQKLAEGI